MQVNPVYYVMPISISGPESFDPENFIQNFLAFHAKEVLIDDVSKLTGAEKQKLQETVNTSFLENPSIPLFLLLLSFDESILPSPLPPYFNLSSDLEEDYSWVNRLDKNVLNRIEANFHQYEMSCETDSELASLLFNTHTIAKEHEFPILNAHQEFEPYGSNLMRLIVKNCKAEHLQSYLVRSGDFNIHNTVFNFVLKLMLNSDFEPKFTTSAQNLHDLFFANPIDNFEILKQTFPLSSTYSKDLALFSEFVEKLHATANRQDLTMLSEHTSKWLSKN